MTTATDWDRIADLIEDELDRAALHARTKLHMRQHPGDCALCGRPVGGDAHDWTPESLPLSAADDTIHRLVCGQCCAEYPTTPYVRDIRWKRMMGEPDHV